MINTIIRFAILLILLIINVALLSWGIDQLNLAKNTLSGKTLISSVQAKATPSPTTHQNFAIQVTQPLSHGGKFQVGQIQPLQEQPASQQIALEFQSTELEMSEKEQKKLDELIQSLNVTPAYRVQVLAGPVSAEKQVISIQTAKLRAQMVARTIYPYTQSIKMIYRPTLKEETVVVEFYQPTTKNFIQQ